MKAFPSLSYDKNFKITSPENPDYNCIAWTYGKVNCWMWPNEDSDGVDYWPNNYLGGPDVKAFIEAFKKIGYEVCENDELEDGFLKIALYTIPHTTECTHAARQLNNGCWTSKLGSSNDIQHSTPYSIQGRLYGNVYCILKTKIT